MDKVRIVVGNIVASELFQDPGDMRGGIPLCDYAASGR